jgi:hypothetical protein
MKKRVSILCALVLFVAGSVAAIDRVIDTSVFDLTGPAITIAVYNPEGNAQTVQVQVAVLCASGQEVLTSGSVVVGPGATSYVTLTAGSTIVAIQEGPDPIMP